MTKKELESVKCVSMQYFLEVYYDVAEDISHVISKNSHKSLGKVARLYGVRLAKMSFEKVTREMVNMGDVIFVLDCFGNAAPYINPKINFEDEFNTTMDEKFVSHVVEGDECDKYKRR